MAARGYTSNQLVLQLGRHILDGTRRDGQAALRGWRARQRGHEAGGAELTDYDPLAPDVIRDRSA